MAAVAHELPVRRPQLVGVLLEEIEEHRRRIYAAQANGVQPAGFRSLKDELRGLREQLARVVSR